MQPSAWDPKRYETSHAFVWERGRDVVDLLAPEAGERILDAGCGTGQLTDEIHRRGARVTGADHSPAMLETARRNFPRLDFVLADIAALPFRDSFDAVFSNAALHWVRDAARAAASMSASLKPGGRFVAELGGRGNCARVIASARQALREFGVENPPHPWFYPSLAEYAALLEQSGFEVTFATLFDRPTPLDGGLEGWLNMFAGSLLATVPAEDRPRLVRRAEEIAAPELFRNGVWIADYRRLRISARKLSAR
jgi:trans-aconitate 2-methyltransferase